MITEFKLNPYPRRMWVAKDENFDQLKESFHIEYDITDEIINSEYCAIVFRCHKDNLAGFLVYISKDCDEGDLAHEAVHVALNVYEDCSMELKPGMDQEPLAYLIEYIYRLLTNKIKS